ncbi:hypothetical protein AB5J49_32845 [Streptomyces sp. R28]|uniref:Uncharacterized protein n=1 Tax=Streptomyces sp. R28 TaxID=3238628 RepID=A0AB39Q593_9ACTN
MLFFAFAFAFAFAVIADPVSSVAYAIEAALRALDGDLALLIPTMSPVIGLVVVVTADYWQLVRRFPKGGGAAAAAGRAFGPNWTFLPIGALVVDFVLAMRGWPILSLVATLLIAGGLYARWVRAGRPTGIEDVESQAEQYA